MNGLLAEVIEAHGGMNRWQRYETGRCHDVSGGGFFALKGVLQDPDPRRMTVWLHEERSSLIPYGGPGSARHVHSGKDRRRKVRWIACCRALRAKGLVCRPSDEHAMGRAASRLLQRRSAVDVFDYPLSPRHERRACR
jgi:hypothetical protein